MYGLGMVAHAYNPRAGGRGKGEEVGCGQKATPGCTVRPCFK